MILVLIYKMMTCSVVVVEWVEWVEWAEVGAHTPMQQITSTSSVIPKVSSRSLLEWRAALISTFLEVSDLAVPSEAVDPVVSLEPGLVGPHGNLTEGVRLLNRLYPKGV